MIGLKISFKGKAESGIEAILGRIKNQKPMWDRVAIMVHRSVMMNFAEGGRPEKWRPSQRALRQHGQTLIDTGRGRADISRFADNERAVVGTSLDYMVKHQKGDGVPKRPFLVLQEIDRAAALRIAGNFIAGSKL